MSGFFDWLTGNTAGKVIDAVAGGLDSMVFTDQERTNALTKLQEVTSPQNVARRFIAVIVVGLWAFLILLGIALYLGGGTESAKYVFQVLTDVVLQPFSIIIGFYYLAHVVRAGKG